MIRKYVSISILFLLLNPFICFAKSQYLDGFIVTNDKDTVVGKIELRPIEKNEVSCNFQKEGVEKEYTPKEIRGFGYDNGKFYSSEVLKDSFVEVIVAGKLSLYLYQTTFLVRKMGGEPIKLLREERFEFIEAVKYVRYDQKWRGLLIYLMSDCLPNATHLVNNIHYGLRELTTLVVKYNRASHKEFVDFNAQKPWSKVRFGASMSLLSSTITIESTRFNHLFLANKYSSLDPAVGLVVDISSPRFLERFSLQPELFVTKSNYSKFVSFPGHHIYNYDSYIDYTTIALPISFRYAFPGRKYSFFIQSGIEFDYNLFASTKLVGERVEDNIVYVEPTRSAFDIYESTARFWGGVEFMKSFEHLDVSANLRYYNWTRLYDWNGLDVQTNRFGFTLIFRKR